MKKLSTTLGFTVLLTVGVAYCMLRSEESMFLYSMIGFALFLAGSVFYASLQISQLIQRRLSKLDEFNMVQNDEVRSSLTNFIAICSDNNKQISQNIDQLRNHQSEIMTGIKKEHLLFLSDVRTDQRQHQNELENTIKEALFKTNQAVTNMHNTFTGSLDTWIKTQNGFTEEARRIQNGIFGNIKSTMEQLKEEFEQGQKNFGKQVAGHYEAMNNYDIESHVKMGKILEANKLTTIAINDYLCKQEELMLLNNQELTATSLENQEDLSRKMELISEETKIMIEDLAELLGGYSKDLTKVTNEFLQKIADDLESRHEEGMNEIISESKKQSTEVMNHFEKYAKEIRINTDDLKKLVADIGSEQVNLVRKLDERQEAYRLMNAEDIEIMKDIMK